MQNIKRFVEHAKMDHEERLQDIRIQMKSLPPGDLIFARKNQKYYCVQKLNDQRFGITRDQQLVQGLALKRYLQEERDALQDNLKILDKVLKSCQNTSFDDIMQSLPPGFRQQKTQWRITSPSTNGMRRWMTARRTSAVSGRTSLCQLEM